VRGLDDIRFADSATGTLWGCLLVHRGRGIDFTLF
jgi:hypothetical protein